MTSFSVLSLPQPLARAVEVLGHTQMTPVQAHTLPPLLEGRDVIAQARTGSGKTLAFGLALLARIDLSVRNISALVMCPTRELADQVTAELRRLGRFLPNLKVVTLCGGVPVRTQRPSLEHPPHVVVGTPGRLLDHLARETMQLRDLRVLVLDEADRMLDMGFVDQIAGVVEQSPPNRQTLLFSATFPAEVREISARLQNNPVSITVDTDAPPAEIEQIFYDVQPAQKLDALMALLSERAAPSALVFCHTRNDTRAVVGALEQRGVSALALHGELDQRTRDEVLLQFAHGSCSVLVATDVAARGLDIKALPLVVSFELPIDPDVHVHRVGRTGRAGETGVALALCAPHERVRAEAIEAHTGVRVTWGQLPAGRSFSPPPAATMITFVIEGGRQDKLRPGDLLGALTGDLGVAGDAVGKIDVLPKRSYVSVRREAAAVLGGGRKVKIKGRMFHVGRLRPA